MKLPYGLIPENISIKKLISGSFVTMLIILSMVVFFVLQFLIRPMLLENNDKIVVQFGQKVVNQALNQIQTAEMLTTAIATLGATLEYDEQRFKQALPELMNSKQQFLNLVAGGGIWPEPYAFDPGKERNSLFWGRQENQHLKFFDDYNTQDSSGYHDKEWYVPVQHLKKGECYWSKVYVDPFSHQPMVTCSAPVIKDSKFIGVATIDLNLEGLTDFFQSRKLSPNGYVFALDRNNYILSPPTDRSIQKPAMDDPDYPYVNLKTYSGEKADFSQLIELLNSINREIENRVSVKMHAFQLKSLDISKRSSEIDGDEARLIYSLISMERNPEPALKKIQERLDGQTITIEDPFILHEKGRFFVFLVPKTFWRVIVAIPESQTQHAVNSVFFALLATLFFFIAAPLLLLYTALKYVFLTPLTFLSKQLKALDGTSHQDRLQLGYKSNNELGELVRCLIWRTDRLNETIKKLKTSESDYRAIFDEINEAIFIHEFETGKILDVNKAMLNMFHVSLKEARGKTAEDFSLGEEPYGPLAVQQKTRDMLNEGPQVFEWRTKNAKGDAFWCEVSLKTANLGTTKRILAVARDISTRKKVQAELDHYKNYLLNIINSTPSIVLGFNEKHLVTLWNKAAENHCRLVETIGVTPIAEGLLIEDLIPMLHSLIPEVDSCLASGPPLKNYRLKYAHAEEEHYYNVTVYPLTLKEEIGGVIRIDDITSTVRKEQELVQAQKMESIGILAGGLAHDFNNVLSGITGSLSMLDLAFQKEKQPAAVTIQKYLGFMNSASDKAKDLINRLLTLSRKQDFKKRPTDLNDCIENVMKICSNSFDKSVILKLESNHKNAVALVDSNQIEQALLNLMINAEHAMTIMRAEGDIWGGDLSVQVNTKTMTPPGGPEPAQFYMISVRDTGIGIPGNVLKNMHNPFFTTKTKEKGSGLGLSMVYNIITQHDGFLEVHTSEGKGTQIHIFLPCVDQALEKKETGTEKLQINTLSGTVLLVDDNDSIRTLGKELLENMGLTVLLAENGKVAIEVLKEHKESINLIILDMVMPVMQGDRAFQEIKKIAPNLKVIMSSGFKADRRVIRTLEEGACDFIQKPYGYKSLYDICFKTLNLQ